MSLINIFDVNKYQGLYVADIPDLEKPDGFTLARYIYDKLVSNKVPVKHAENTGESIFIPLNLKKDQISFDVFFDGDIHYTKNGILYAVSRAKLMELIDEIISNYYSRKIR